MEKWLAVPGKEGRYEVSDYGQVLSLEREGRNRHGVCRIPSKVLTPFLTGTKPYQYLTVRLYDGSNGYRNHRVHQLVLQAFVGPQPEGLLALHRNGDYTDNRLENLRYGTPSENTQDSKAHGTHFNSAKTHCKSGHEFTPENTYTYQKSGYECRACRTCARENQRRYRGN